MKIISTTINKYRQTLSKRHEPPKVEFQLHSKMIHYMYMENKTSYRIKNSKNWIKSENTNSSFVGPVHLQHMLTAMLASLAQNLAVL